MYYLVAPRVGAWIETRCQIGILNEGRVAPRVGAWIETSRRVVSNNHQESHPEWVRGLKLLVAGRIGGLGESHPEWVRGLKLRNDGDKKVNSCRTPSGCVD